MIVAVMAAASAVSMAMASLNFGLFIKPMGDDLGIGRSTFGWAMTARQVVSSGTSPFVGRLLDRFGARLLLPLSAVITGAAMIGLGVADRAWQLVLMFAVMGIVGMSGPGALVTTVPVLKWFIRDRGKAVAFMSLGIPIGAVIFVPLTQVLIDTWGWRGAWIGLAIISVAIIVPLAIVFVRRQPEDLGLRPDGVGSDLGPRPEEPTAAAAEETSWSAGEAARAPAFWWLVAIFSVSALGVGAVGVHRIPAFMDRGLDARVISFATAFDAVCAGASVFTMGMLVRKLPARYLGAIGFLLLGSASILTIYAYTPFIMFLSMAIFGLGIGGTMFLQNFLWADYFGRKHLGSIGGIVAPITLLIGGIGAPLAGYMRDATGSYDLIWWIGILFMFLSALALCFVRAPAKPLPARQSALGVAGT